MMCKFKNLLFREKYEQHKNEFENKYRLGNQALKQIATQIYYVEHKIINQLKGCLIFNQFYQFMQKDINLFKNEFISLNNYLIFAELSFCHLVLGITHFSNTTVNS